MASLPLLFLTFASVPDMTKKSAYISGNVTDFIRDGRQQLAELFSCNYSTDHGGPHIELANPSNSTIFESRLSQMNMTLVPAVFSSSSNGVNTSVKLETQAFEDGAKPVKTHATVGFFKNCPTTEEQRREAEALLVKIAQGYAFDPWGGEAMSSSLRGADSAW